MIHFDAATVPLSERFAYWHNEFSLYFYRADAWPLQPQTFQARLTRTDLGCIQIGSIECEPVRSERAASHVRTAPTDEFFLSVMLEGEGQLEQHRRLSRQKPGDIVVYDAAQPFLYDLLERHRLVLLKIPRRAMLARVPEAETCTSQLISGETALGSLAATIIRDAASLNIDDAHAAARIGTSILDIIAAAIDVELVRNVPALNHQATVFNRAQEYIRSHLDDPDITVDSIADGICISTSTLARLFAGAGTTVMRWLWEERLTVGHRALVEGRAQRVTEVALMCGFTSFSHFSRRFRARFGHSPSALIRENSISHCASTAPS